MLLLAVVFPLVVIVAAVALGRARRGPFRSLAIAPAQRPSAASAILRIRLRNFAAISAAMLAASTLTVAAIVSLRMPDVPKSLDVLLLVVPILTAIAAVAPFAFVPTFRETSATRTAELAPRTPRTFGARSEFILPVIVAAGLAAIVGALGLAAAEDGRSIAYQEGSHSGAAGPFPGFAYGVVILVGIALLAGVVIVVLRRIASAPRPSEPSLRGADTAARLLAVRVVMKTATSALVLTLGTVLYMAGVATAAVSRGMSGPDGVNIPGNATLEVIGTAELWAGVVLMLATVVFVVGAVSDATRKPFEILSVAEAAEATAGAEAVP